jgi:hypothetical protein
VLRGYWVRGSGGEARGNRVLRGYCVRGSGGKARGSRVLRGYCVRGSGGEARGSNCTTRSFNLTDNIRVINKGG